MSGNKPSNGPAAQGATAAAPGAEPFVPLLTTLDWNEEWKALQRARRTADDAAYWDKRSATFGTKDAPNPYVERFLQLSGIRPGETVLDMGCGTGALALPLAEAGCDVVAADFSRGMLDVLESDARARGIGLGAVPTPSRDALSFRFTDEALSASADHGSGFVETKQMSWEDDWETQGLGPDSVDVALASRSIATADLRDSLRRLSTVARRRVCITLSTGSSPRADETLLAELGLAGQAGRDYLYAFNILASEGVMPEVSYIGSVRDDTFDTREDARASFARMIDSALRIAPKDSLDPEEEARRSRALERLEEWLDANLVPNPNAGAPDRKGVPQGRLKTRRPRIISWAFIAWNK